MVLRVTQQVEPPSVAFETAYEAQSDLSSVIGLAFEQASAKLIRFIFTNNPLRQHGEEMALTWQRSRNVFARKPFENQPSPIGTSRHDETNLVPSVGRGTCRSSFLGMYNEALEVESRNSYR